MTVSYPITLPSSPRQQQIDIQLAPATAINRGIFAKKQQTQDYLGHQIRATITIPPMNDKATAGEWVSTLNGLRGTRGTFKVAFDYRTDTQGNGTSTPISIDSISSDNTVLTTTGWTADTDNLLLPGDWIEANGEFKMVGPQASVDSDGSGEADVAVQPAFRSDPSGNDLIYQDPQTTWRLTENNPDWSVRHIIESGIVLDAQEAF